MTLTERLKAARKVGVPIIAISTPDPAQTRRAVCMAFDNAESKTPIPIVEWDAVNGITALNEFGTTVLEKVLGADPTEWAGLTSNPNSALVKMAELPGEIREGTTLKQRGSIVFMQNAQRYLEDRTGVQNGVVLQGIWNLRDLYKANRRTLVLLGPGFKFPAEIAQDVISFEEPYPSVEVLTGIVTTMAGNASVKLTEKVIEAAVAALLGLSAFTAEQVVAMSLTKDGLDVEELWTRKIAVVEQTDGLTVDGGTECFDDVQDLDNFTEFAKALMNGDKAPTLYVRIDEMEKSFGGLGGNGGAGDNTGITQDRLGVLLKTMEDKGHTGLIAVGHAGTGKTLITKALANTSTKITGRRVLSISLDLGAMGTGIASSAERQMRTAMNVIESMAGGGKVMFVATCNDISIIPAALKRRFKLGTWMFDLPSPAGRTAMWKQYMKAFSIKPQAVPDSTDWTGSDIRNVCEVADAIDSTLEKACSYVTFVAKSDPDAIERLRRVADGKFVSASTPGVYKAPKRQMPGAAKPMTTADFTGKPGTRVSGTEE